MAKIRSLLALLLFVCLQSASAQTFTPAELHKIDSVQRLIRVAKSDTARLSLRYALARLTQQYRPTFWDSIYLEASIYKMTLLQCRTLRVAAYSYMLNKDTIKAIPRFKLAMQIAERHGHNTELFALIWQMGYVYGTNLLDKRRLELNYRGLALAQSIHDTQAEINFNSANGTYYFLSGDYKKALEIHQRCLQLSKQENYAFGISSALVDLGADYQALKDTAKTIACYLECIHYVDAVSGTIYEPYLYKCVGAAYNFSNKPDSAILYFDKAIALSTSFNDMISIESSFAGLADAYLRKGNTRKAKEFALKSLAMAKEYHFASDIPLTALTLKNIYLQEKNYPEALKAYELYINVRDSLSNETVRKQALEKEYAFTIEKKENENIQLVQQNQIKTLELKQNAYFSWGLGGLVVLSLLMTLLIVRQNKFRTQQQRMRLEQKLLYSQMNPHFIFNALNSIQYLVMSNANEKAELYLSKFAKLIREFLESNTKESIPIKEEVTILNGYVAMEAMRFSESFSYSIQVDEQLNQEQIHIPHMMLQPFVENAIWHGLLHKKGERKLQVHFHYDTETTIRCEIDDNGVGREASRKTESTFKKKSLALSFVQQRLELMRKTFKVNCRLQIIDKKDTEGLFSGTKIVLYLPILKSPTT